MSRSQLIPTKSSNMMRQQIQRDSLKTCLTFWKYVATGKRKKKYLFFPSIYMKMRWSFNYLKVMRRISQSSDFILILPNGSESKCVKDMTQLWKLLLTRQNKWKLTIVNQSDKKVVPNYIKTQKFSHRWIKNLISQQCQMNKGRRSADVNH